MFPSQKSQTKYDLQEEEKYNTYSFQHTNIIIKHEDSKAKINFVVPRVDDYMNCNHDISKCNAISRIVHLLGYYKSCESKQLSESENEEIIPLHEYISSLNKYTISTFMEDWYHSKTIHFKKDNDFKWFQNNEQSKCAKNCIHMSRHQRQRGKEKYNVNGESDLKNIILRDQIDSIHAFIFHSVSFRMNTVHRQWEDDSSEDINEETHQTVTINEHENIVLESIWTEMVKDEQQTHIESVDNKTLLYSEKQSSDEIQNPQEDQKYFINGPKLLMECNISQISSILNNLEIFNKSDALLKYKHDIINYIMDNNLDGAKLSKLNRKEFLNQISSHLNDKKIRAPLGQLYNSIMSIDFSVYNVNTEDIELNQDIWFTQPSTLQDCTLKQISYILTQENGILSSLNKLNPLKHDIIQYIKDNDLDGGKLLALKRKTFMNNLSEHLNNKKLRVQVRSFLKQSAVIGVCVHT
eukprot:501248_1